MQRILRIGTRDSQLAVWQATLVKELLAKEGVLSELVYIKSEGDVDTVTPLYALGVTGVFTRALDTALLNERVDLAVHSMKDVPTQLAQGLTTAAVLKGASYKDILVYKGSLEFLQDDRPATVATGSVRRIAQWLHRFPHHRIENLRGNVNTRLRKLEEHGWNGAIFAAAGLERIGLRPAQSIDLDWMLPAPAQGAIMVTCRQQDEHAVHSCRSFHDEDTSLCAGIERDFLSALMGGCSTPISALAEIRESTVTFRGNMLSPDGSLKREVHQRIPAGDAAGAGRKAAAEILQKGGDAIIQRIRTKGLTTNGDV